MNVSIDKAYEILTHSQNVKIGNSLFVSKIMEFPLLFHLGHLYHDDSLIERANDIIISLYKVITGSNAFFSQKELFRFGYFLAYLDASNFLKDDISTILEEYDSLSRKFTMHNDFTIAHFANVSPYLIMRYENSSVNLQNRNRILHTMLLQINMLSIYFESQKSFRLHEYIDALKMHASPDNVIIQTLVILYKYHVLYIFPARTQRLIMFILDKISVLYNEFNSYNKIIVNTIAARLNDVRYWHYNKDILTQFDVHHTLPSCNDNSLSFIKKDGFLYMILGDCYYIRMTAIEK